MVALLDFFSGCRQGCVHHRTRVPIHGSVSGGDQGLDRRPRAGESTLSPGAVCLHRGLHHPRSLQRSQKRHRHRRERSRTLRTGKGLYIYIIYIYL